MSSKVDISEQTDCRLASSMKIEKVHSNQRKPTVANTISYFSFILLFVSAVFQMCSANMKMSESVEL